MSCNAKIYLLESTEVSKEGEHTSKCKILDVRGRERHMFNAVRRKATENLDNPPTKLVRRGLQKQEFTNLLDIDLTRVCKNKKKQN